MQGHSARVWLFYLKHLRGERGKLGLNVTREACEYLPFYLQLAKVTKFSLRFFAHAWKPRVRLHIDIHADEGSAWVVLKDGRLFCSGARINRINCEWRGWTAAYLLSRNGAVEQLPDMTLFRCAHGVIQVMHIYVFGGCKL